MGKFTAYKLQLKSLAEGTHEFDYKIDKQFFVNMEYADVRDADLDVHLTVTYRNSLYKLAFRITGTLTLLCDRCLDDMVLPVDTTYNVNVEYGDAYNDESDDLLIIPQSDNYINVAYMLFDTVVLVIPMKHVHPAGKCNRAMSALLKKHRAHTAGEDDGFDDEMPDTADDAGTAHTDPRWNALRGLASDDGADSD